MTKKWRTSFLVSSFVCVFNVTVNNILVSVIYLTAHTHACMVLKKRPTVRRQRSLVLHRDLATLSRIRYDPTTL